jgi:hypothetical protein
VAEPWFRRRRRPEHPRTCAEMVAVRAESATFDVARPVIFAGTVEYL